MSELLWNDSPEVLSLLDLVHRTSQPTPGGDSGELIRGANGYQFGDNEPPQYWVQIVRHEDPVVEWAYSGKLIRVGTDFVTVPDQYLTFTGDKFPLIEMTENTDVPDNAIARAYPDPSGQFYTFLWSGNMEESGSGLGSGEECSDAPGINISDFLICTDDGAAIRDGRLVICNGRLQFIPEE